MNVLLLILISSIIIIGVEMLKRKFALSTTITRRVIHIGTSIVAGVAPLFVTREELIFVCIIFTIVLLLGRRSSFFSAIHSVDRSTFGEVYLPLGIMITAIFFLPNEIKVFQFGIFIMGISDALAGLIGERIGMHHILFLNNKKSLEGSLTFFMSSIILTFIFFPIFGYQLFLIPIILTIVEFVFVYGLDNLVLPIVAAFLIKLLF